MPSRRIIDSGSTVHAKLELSQASDPAHLFIAYAPDDGAPTGKSGRAVLGKPAEVELKVDGMGRLEVFADLASQGDKGQLVVKVNGKVRNDLPLTGDQGLAYSVFPPATPDT